MEFKKCEKCGHYGFAPCSCKPFKVYYPEYFGEEKEEIYGTDFESVAEHFAETINEDEPVFETNIFETPIEVTDENGITKKFNCTASISVDYSATEIE